MALRDRILAAGLGLSILLGGCGVMDFSKADKEANQNKENKDQHEQRYVRVQDYKGDGSRLRNFDDKVDEIAHENEMEIEKAVKNLMREHYHTEITVHNLVGADGYVSVFFESQGELTYYSWVNVPVDKKQETVLIDRVYSLQGTIENAITSSIYQKIHKEEFDKLDTYLEKTTAEYDLTGLRQEALASVTGRGYSTPLYFISATSEKLDSLYEAYMQNEGRDLESIISQFDKSQFEAKDANITIILFMEEKKTEPSKEAFYKIGEDIEGMQGLAPGYYSIILNDNDIDKISGRGTKDSQLTRKDPDHIIKE